MDIDEAVMIEQGYPAGCGRCKALREALEQIAAWSWDSGSIPAPEVVSRIYCEARAALAQPEADK